MNRLVGNGFGQASTLRNPSSRPATPPGSRDTPESQDLPPVAGKGQSRCETESRLSAVTCGKGWVRKGLRNVLFPCKRKQAGQSGEGSKPSRTGELKRREGDISAWIRWSTSRVDAEGSQMPRHQLKVTNSAGKSCASLNDRLVMGRRGDTVKLRGPPKAATTKSASQDTGGQGNDLGYGKNVADVQWIIRSQVRLRLMQFID